MTGLTEDEKKLWQALTKGVKPLDNRPASPVEHQPRIKVSATFPVPFNPVLDLHGLTIQDAYFRVQDHIADAISLKWRRLTIITGRSGPINLELPRWVGKIREVGSVTPLNGGGAWEIWLRKDT